MSDTYIPWWVPDDHGRRGVAASGTQAPVPEPDPVEEPAPAEELPPAEQPDDPLPDPPAAA